MNDHVAEADRGATWCFACSVISASGSRAKQLAGLGAAWLHGAGPRYRRAAPGGADRRCCGASFCWYGGPLRAQLNRQLGEGDVSAGAAAYHQGQRFHRWRQRLAGRASELEQALRRADPLRGMEILAGIRLDELRTLCDACLLRLQAMFGDVQAESAS